MSDDYVRAKIKEAVNVSGGDHQDAQRLVVTWAVRDMALLIGLCKPHLKAIVAARFEQSSKSGRKQSDAGKTGASAKSSSEKRAAVVPPPRTSSRQASVMRQIADAFKTKKK